MNPRFILLWVSILVVGCQTALPPRDLLAPTDPRPSTLVRSLESAADTRSSLSAALRLSLDAPDLHLRRPQRLVLRRPADMRMEVLGLFGQVAAVLVTNGATYQSFDARNSSFESGEVTPDLLWRNARVALQPGEAVDLLLGTLLPSADASLSGAYARANGGVSLEFRDSKGRLRDRFDFDTQGRLREFARFAGNGDVAWEASFADYREVSGSPFAFEVELRFPEVGARASLRFDHVVLDPELGDEFFALRISAAADPQ